MTFPVARLGAAVLLATSAAASGAAGCSLINLDPLAEGDATATRGAGGASASSSHLASTGDNSAATSAASAATTSTATSNSAASSGTTSAATTSGAGVPLLQDCVLLLHMDEAAWVDAGDVADASDQGNHGTAMDAATPGPGRYGNGAVLTGTERIVVAHAPSLQAEGGLTYMAWVRPASLEGNPGIIAKRVSFRQEAAFTLFLLEDMMLGGSTWTADIENTRFRASFLTPVDEWHHVAVVFDGARPQAERSRIFVDGSLAGVASGPVTLAPNTVDITIGALPAGMTTPPAGFFKGVIDEVAIWRRALSDEEILQIASADAPL